MQPQIGKSICVWCASAYHLQRSHARSASLFCSRKCEAEARYWLYALLGREPERQ